MKTPNRLQRMHTGPYTLKELANLYGVSRRTMLRWVKRHRNEMGERVGYLFTPKQVQIFVRLNGRPDEDDE